jgi:hypothetical protein
MSEKGRERVALVVCGALAVGGCVEYSVPELTPALAQICAVELATHEQHTEQGREPSEHVLRTQRIEAGSTTTMVRSSVSMAPNVEAWADVLRRV